MKKLLVVVLVLAVAVGGLAYWRGWFSVTRDGKVDVQGDRTKFQKDKDAFSKMVGEKAKTMKEKLSSLGKKSEGLTGADKAQAQKELADLKARHDRLEQQIKELDAAGEERFESIRQDLSKSLDEVEKKIEELNNKLEKSKDK